MGKKCVKALYCHRDYLIYMQNTSCKVLGWMKHKPESRLPREIAITSDIRDDITHTAESKEELKSLLMKVKSDERE